MKYIRDFRLESVEIRRLGIHKRADPGFKREKESRFGLTGFSDRSMGQASR